MTGGTHLPAKEEGKLSRRVDVGSDFETHRAAVESVSVLFKLFDVVDEELVEVPSGWRVTGAQFEVQWPSDSERRNLVTSHLGAPRFAFNWGLARVKRDLDAKKENSDHRPLGWSLAALRKEWNVQKDDVAPWWAENSKECYSAGLTDLAQALTNWSTSKSGTRKGKRVGFPNFQSKRGDKDSVRFTTGATRFNPDRRTINLPVIGALHSKENTRRVQRHLAKGNARVFNITLTQRWGRLFVSVNYALRVAPVRAPLRPATRAGVDLGLRSLATISDTDGRRITVDNPAPLRATLNERRRVARQLSRRIPGSKAHRSAKDTLARLDRRAVHLRQEAWHQLTNELVATYAEIVVEDLDLGAMKKSMGQRAFRRSVSDAALGQFRPLLSYKKKRTGTNVIVADRFFASSQTHHGCGCRLTPPPGKGKLSKFLVCAVTGEPVDRDDNAADNLRDWPGHANLGLVEAHAPVVSSLASGGEDAGSDAGLIQRRRSDCETSASDGGAGCGEARTTTTPHRVKNLERGAA